MLTPATNESERVRFRTLNPATGDRIYTRHVDAATGKTVDDEHQIKAYEKAEDDYVVLEDEGLGAVKRASGETWTLAEPLGAG